MHGSKSEGIGVSLYRTRRLFTSNDLTVEHVRYSYSMKKQWSGIEVYIDNQHISVCRSRQDTGVQSKLGT